MAGSKHHAGSGSPDQTQGTPDVDRLWSEHLPLLVGLASGLFVTIRIFSLSDFNVETAYGILQSGDTTTVLLGAALSSVGLICVAITMICWFRYLNVPWDSIHEITVQRQLNSLVGISSGVIAVFTAPVEVIAVIVLLIIAYFVLAEVVGPLMNRLQGGPTDSETRAAIGRRDPDKGHAMQAKKERHERASQRYMKFAVIPFVLSILALPPWMPAEKLSIKGARPVVAYVLSESDTEVTVLLIRTRQIEYLDSSSITSRAICNDGTVPPASEPLSTFLHPHAAYPDCPVSP